MTPRKKKQTIDPTLNVVYLSLFSVAKHTTPMQPSVQSAILAFFHPPPPPSPPQCNSSCLSGADTRMQRRGGDPEGGVPKILSGSPSFESNPRKGKLLAAQSERSVRRHHPALPLHPSASIQFVNTACLKSASSKNKSSNFVISTAVAMTQGAVIIGYQNSPYSLSAWAKASSESFASTRVGSPSQVTIRISSVNNCHSSSSSSSSSSGFSLCSSSCILSARAGLNPRLVLRKATGTDGLYDFKMTRRARFRNLSLICFNNALPRFGVLL
mmetsp:Transcript_8642/g.13662  ORF Transcript_8642/g.13662 Transcript_8642/m.13662 type:complete len:270 (-) Transcript_8642:1913-2722(-)